MKRVCLEPNCPNLSDKPRCSEHRSQRERDRGTRQERGYDAEYDMVARDYQRRMDEGERFTCWRPTCNKPLGARRGTDWTLGHDDHDRSIIRGPECPACQYATSSRR